jgi:rhodanese-related sulfurtransferase
MNRTIIDVRTREEFNEGHVEGSFNIPLHEIPERLEEIRELPAPLLLCCASGNRSGQATAYLKANGIDCSNGGSWLSLKIAP